MGVSITPRRLLLQQTAGRESSLIRRLPYYLIMGGAFAYATAVYFYRPNTRYVNPDAQAVGWVG